MNNYLPFSDVLCDNTRYAVKIEKTQYLENGEYVIIDQGKNDIAGYSNNSEGLYCDIPAIVFGDHTRIIKYIDKPCYIGADGVKLLGLTEAYKGYFDYRFLYYFLLNQNIPNTGYNRHFKWLKDIHILHLPIPRQREIAEVLDKASELVALRKKQLKEFDSLAESVFYDMFGDPVTNSKGWKKKGLGELGYFKNGLNFSKNSTLYPVKIVGVSDFKDKTRINQIDLLDEICTHVPVNTEYLLNNDDIVFVRSNGSKELVGRCVIVNFEKDAAVTFSGFCIRFRKENNCVHTIYLISTLSNKEFRKQLFSKGRGCNINNINQQMLSALVIPIPSLELQQQFASIIEKIEEQKQKAKAALEESENLFQRLMQDLFNPECHKS